MSSPPDIPCSLAVDIVLPINTFECSCPHACERVVDAHGEARFPNGQTSHRTLVLLVLRNRAVAIKNVRGQNGDSKYNCGSQDNHQRSQHSAALGAHQDGKCRQQREQSATRLRSENSRNHCENHSIDRETHPLRLGDGTQPPCQGQDNDQTQRQVIGIAKIGFGNPRQTFAAACRKINNGSDAMIATGCNKDTNKNLQPIERLDKIDNQNKKCDLLKIIRGDGVTLRLPVRKQNGNTNHDEEHHKELGRLYVPKFNDRTTHQKGTYCQCRDQDHGTHDAQSGNNVPGAQNKQSQHDRQQHEWSLLGGIAPQKSGQRVFSGRRAGGRLRNGSHTFADGKVSPNQVKQIGGRYRHYSIFAGR